MNEFAVLALVVPVVAVGVAYVAVRHHERQMARLKRDLEAEEAGQARRAALV